MSKKILELNDEKLQETIEWEPFKGQQKIIDAYDNGKKDIRMSCGVRWGKSALAAYLALREWLKTDKHIWIVAPSYDLSKKVFSYITRWVERGFPQSVELIQTNPTPRIENPKKGTWIECKSTDSEKSLVGEELDLIIGDEVAWWDKEVHQRYLRARLSSRDGTSVYISTPRGKNWFFKDFMRQKQNERGFTVRHKSVDSPYFPRKRWGEIKKEIPTDLFRQEYEARFLESAATVFSYEDLEEISSKGCKDAPKSDRRYVMGADLAKMEDYTVVTVIDKYTHNIVDFKRWQGDSWPMTIDRIVETSRRYNNARVYLDSTGLGDPVSDELKNRGLIPEDFKFSGKTKEQLINKLRLYIEDHAIEIPEEEGELRDELESYSLRRVSKKTGKALKHPHYSAPSGMHDDCVESLALAVWGLQSPQKENPRRKIKKSETTQKNSLNYI